MLHLFQSHIRQNKLCKATDKILLAVSGGLDSMVMVHLFRQGGYHFSVAHCNFQLRGAESDGDEEFVKQKCGHFSIPFFTHRFETNNYATTNGVSIQMAARELRYAWFNNLLSEEKYDWVATAHHLNDSIETVLLNLTKGSGIEGLCGIAVKNKKVIRPLLFATREEIENYAAAEGITWREDSSNSTDDYQRNFIRHQLVPRLNELNPSWAQAVQRSMEKLKGAEELRELGIQQWKSKNQKSENGKIILSKNGFEKLENPAPILWTVIKEYGFNLDQCQEIIRTFDGQSGKKFSSLDFELVVDRNSLIIFQSHSWDEILIEKGQNEARLSSMFLQIKQEKSPLITDDKSAAFLDAHLLTFPLLWRKWKAGDSFQPLGMQNRKKLSDFLIDEKISLADKESATIIESNGEIVWVVGHRIDERFKVKKETSLAIIMSVEPYF